MPSTEKKEVKSKTKPKNDLLAPGIRRFGKRKWKRLTGRHFKYTKATKSGLKARKVTVKKAGKEKKFNKGKEVRVVKQKTPHFYPAEARPKKLPTTRTLRAPTIRTSLRPGTVVILLAGRYKGQRCVVLKHLKSGLICVTGPYKINGIPLRRVNPAYVIATSTSVDLKGVTVSDKINDDYFRAAKKKAEKKPEKTDSKVVESKKEESSKHKVDSSRVADQKAIDEALIKNIKQVPQLGAYLSSVFCLKNGDFPHLMKF